VTEPMNATRWGVRAVDTDRVRVYIDGSLFDFDLRGAADLAQTIRVILGIEKPAPAAPESHESADDVGCPQCRGWQSPGSMCSACRTLYPAIGNPVRLAAPETTPDAPTRSPAQANPQVNAPRTANPAQAPDAPTGGED